MLTLLLLTLTGTWLASAALTYREAHRGIDALLDAHLAQAARMLAGLDRVLFGGQAKGIKAGCLSISLLLKEKFQKEVVDPSSPGNQSIVIPRPTVRIVTEPAPVVMFEKVLFVTVFLDPGVVPSALLHPEIDAAPVKVRLEKLLPSFVSVTDDGDDPKLS